MGVYKVEFNHKPVLLNECIENLKINPNGIYVDGTIGGAGHSFEIARRLSKQGLLIGIDKDVKALEVAKEKLKDFKNVKYINDNHDNIKTILEELEITKVDGILLDLGVSSYQIDEVENGFSYMKESPLDMRMDKSQELTAEVVVNTYEEEDLTKILYEYGEEKFAKSISRNICEYRKENVIDNTSKLVEIIEKSIPKFSKNSGGHPAKRTFQAIRIEVNNELEPLHDTVIDSINSLNNNGRLCIITFHSLEDRIVKNTYKEQTENCTCPKDLPYCVCNKKPNGKIVTKKPILPLEKEMEENPRSKSAKLRVFEKQNI
jgi:16S rRNA (cytosine1402-N4)-methyltransferase